MFSQVLLDNISQRISRSIYHSFPHFTCTMFCFMFKILSRGFGNKYLTTQNLIMVLMYFFAVFSYAAFSWLFDYQKNQEEKNFPPRGSWMSFSFSIFHQFSKLCSNNKYWTWRTEWKNIFSKGKRQQKIID